jgi:hypothetical protein
VRSAFAAGIYLTGAQRQAAHLSSRQDRKPEATALLLKLEMKRTVGADASPINSRPG